METNLYKQNEHIQRYLLKDHYSFIGPVDENKFEDFVKLSNKISKKSYFGTIHNVLKDKEATEAALTILGITDRRIFVVVPNSQILFHSTLEEYCKQNNIAL